MDAIKGSLTKFGQVEPLVVQQSTKVVIGGNGRLAAMREMGWSEVDIIEVNLDPIQAKALALALNRSSELAAWDTDVLSETLKDLLDENFDIEKIGFDDSFIKQEEKQFQGDPDEVPENAETRCKPGDLWILGKHRLLCGDSTNVQHVERLMGGEKAELCFTSPPYGQQRDYGVGKVSDWDTLMNGVFSILPVEQSAQVLVNLGLIHHECEWVPYWDNWIKYMRDLEWRRFGLYVWDQGPGLPGDWNGRLAPSFELVFHFNKSSRKPNKTKDCIHAGSKNHGTGLRGKDGKVSGYTAIDDNVQSHKIPDAVIRVMRHKARGIECEHPAVFPIELATEIIEAYSNGNEKVYEPFCGSGSTLIACEKTGRRCFGMEIDPKYCDVILARWEKFTGQTAKLLES